MYYVTTFGNPFNAMHEELFVPTANVSTQAF